MSYDAGDVIVLRDVYDDGVWFAWPLAVAEDSERGLLAWQVPGAVGWVPDEFATNRASLFAQVSSGRRDLVELTWKDTIALHVFVPDQWWSTRLMWSAANGDFLCWYVDLRVPVVRRGSFLDGRDLQLDLVVWPDLTWWWKDEDDLTAAFTAGLISAVELTAVDRTRTAILAAVEHRAFPFDGSLVAPPELGIDAPLLPPGWDRFP